MRKRRKKEAGLNILLGSPWWVSVAVGLVAYVFLRWIIPSLFASSPVLAGVSQLSQSVAWLTLPFFGFIALISFITSKKSEGKSTRYPQTKSRTPNREVVRPSSTSKEEWGRSEPSLVTNPTTVPQTIPSWSLASLRSLEWKRFELLCAKYYEIVGFKSVTLASGADGGIDIKLYKLDLDHPIAIVQCKAWNTKQVGVKELRELLGVMAHEKVARGIFITSRTYSKDALAFGDSNPIHLLDGLKLLERILQLDTSQQEALAKFAFDGDYTTPSCTSCGIKMIMRHSERGSFWGCLHYPRCHTKIYVKKEHAIT
ncbi:restriction endonuclease [Herminiimonas arsenitoxidans]|uniref:restriction endonuclease n=1 Tax=Herminiimonas arsenitoxidans TaxID=1809410 RepID=UPI000971153A|nr:restriction endonuclease [Herminiimonas arsenitoxidans]